MVSIGLPSEAWDKVLLPSKWTAWSAVPGWCDRVASRTELIHHYKYLFVIQMLRFDILTDHTHLLRHSKARQKVALPCLDIQVSLLLQFYHQAEWQCSLSCDHLDGKKWNTSIYPNSYLVGKKSEEKLNFSPNQKIIIIFYNKTNKIKLEILNKVYFFPLLKQNN